MTKIVGEGFLNFLRPLKTSALPLIRNVFTTLSKTILVTLWFTVTESATNGAIQKKIFGSRTTALITLNESLKE